jgi:hypothetical protein
VVRGAASADNSVLFCSPCSGRATGRYICGTTHSRLQCSVPSWLEPSTQLKLEPSTQLKRHPIWTVARLAPLSRDSSRPSLQAVHLQRHHARSCTAAVARHSQYGRWLDGNTAVRSPARRAAQQFSRAGSRRNAALFVRSGLARRRAQRSCSLAGSTRSAADLFARWLDAQRSCLLASLTGSAAVRSPPRSWLDWQRLAAKLSARWLDGGIASSFTAAGSTAAQLFARWLDAQRSGLLLDGWTRSATVRSPRCRADGHRAACRCLGTASHCCRAGRCLGAAFIAARSRRLSRRLPPNSMPLAAWCSVARCSVAALPCCRAAAWPAAASPQRRRAVLCRLPPRGLHAAASAQRLTAVVHRLPPHRLTATETAAASAQRRPGVTHRLPPRSLPLPHTAQRRCAVVRPATAQRVAAARPAAATRYIVSALASKQSPHSRSTCVPLSAAAQLILW